MTYTHEMIDQALINILDEIRSKATIYKNNIKNREYFNTLGAKATIQGLIDDMVEYEHIRKHGAIE